MRILLIEDDKTIADFVCRGLRESGYAVDHAERGIQGLDMALNDSYDLGIFDIMLPDLDGLQVVEKVRERKIGMPIIFLSARRSIEDRVTGLENGADDYLTKPFSFSELLARVHALLRRASNVVEATTLSSHGLTIDILARTANRDDIRIDLQPKEFSLLEYLMRNEGRVVSKTMIMERVWNYNFDPNTNIVEARISKLREKVDREFSVPLIHTVRGLGYVFRAQDD